MRRGYREASPAAGRTPKIQSMNFGSNDHRAETSPPAERSGVPVIEAVGVTSMRSFPNGDGPVINNASLSLRAGEMAVLRGASGSGKSTLLWMLARLEPIVSGEIRLAGVPSAGVSSCEWRSRAALMLQGAIILEGSVRDNVLAAESLAVTRRRGSSGIHTADIPAEMEGIGLAEVDLDRPARELSGGQAARMALLRTLLPGPDCLLLDEPASSLDDANTELVIARVRRFCDEGGCALMVLHGNLQVTGAREMTLSAGRLEEVG